MFTYNTTPVLHIKCTEGRAGERGKVLNATLNSIGFLFLFAVTVVLINFILFCFTLLLIWKNGIGKWHECVFICVVCTCYTIHSVYFRFSCCCSGIVTAPKIHQCEHASHRKSVKWKMYTQNVNFAKMIDHWMDRNSTTRKERKKK